MFRFDVPEVEVVETVEVETVAAALPCASMAFFFVTLDLCFGAGPIAGVVTFNVVRSGKEEA